MNDGRDNHDSNNCFYLVSGMGHDWRGSNWRAFSEVAEVMSITKEKIAELRGMGAVDIDDRAGALEYAMSLVEVSAALLDLAESALWRPIEEAPKDGKDVLIFTQGLCRLGFWDEPNERWSIWPGRDKCEPTHFRPITPPESEEA